MIGIRTDANEIIATGHVMRCIAIAQQLEKLNQEFIFIASDSYTTNFIVGKGYECICINTKWNDKDNEIDKIKECIINNNISKLIIDSYEVTKLYLESLKEYTKVIYIDDLYKFEYPVDVLINYGLNVDTKKYNYQSNRNISFLLGRKYTPLRMEFQNQAIKIRQNVTDVLITTGGSDNLCVVEKIIKRIIDTKEYNSIRFHIVVGRFFRNIEMLDVLAENNKKIILHKNVQNMSKLMKKCDVAISAGGTTLAELCACGLPTICFAIADNQLSGIEIYGNEEIMISIGDIRDNIDESINNIFIALERLMKNKQMREKIVSKGKAFIDGNGARRIAEKVINL